MDKITLYYLIIDGGDGGANLRYYRTYDEWCQAAELEEETGERCPLGEGTIDIFVNKDGALDCDHFSVVED